MIVCLDFRSLYPVMMIGGNLYSPTDKSGWNGGGIYPSVYVNNYDGIKGYYKREPGKVERVIKQLLEERLKVKDDKHKSLAIKIIINTMYGILGSPKFASVHNLQSAADVTAMARRSILHAKTVLEEYGYEVLYNDTDSAYIKDPYNSLEKLKQVTDHIVNEQKKSMNIPCELHDFKVECLIKRMWFFRDDNGKFIKKHYIFLKDNNELVIKGIKVKQGNCSKIAVRFFEEVIKQKMVGGTFVFYTSEQLLKELKEFAVGKDELLLKRYRTNAPESYKITEGKEEATSIHYQIAKKYGAGEHWLIINKRLGPGKGSHYAPIELLKEKYGEYWLDQVCMEEYLKDLSEFIHYKERSKIVKTDHKRITYDKTISD